MQELSYIVALNIKRRRRAKSMTQAQLAAALGYSEKAVSKWESGKGLPPTAVLPRLAKMLGITLGALFTEEVGTPLFLGIDGGGTKTEFVLANSEGAVLRTARLGSSNPNDIGFHAMQEVLRQGIFEVAGEYPPESISVFAGIAGGGSADMAEKIHDFLLRFGFACVKNGSDAQNAISAGLGGDDGIAVIMGTGSIVFGRRGEELLRVGGYGYLLGDAGSGFALGREVILAALQMEDGSGAETSLLPAVLKKSRCESLMPVITDFYRGGRVYIAQYAPLLFDAVREGDAVATRILERHMREVAGLIICAAKKLGKSSVPVVFCGGLATAHSEYILPLVEKNLSEDRRAYALSMCESSLADGALYLAGMPRKDKK